MRGLAVKGHEGEPAAAVCAVGRADRGEGPARGVFERTRDKAPSEVKPQRVDDRLAHRSGRPGTGGERARQRTPRHLHLEE